MNRDLTKKDVPKIAAVLGSLAVVAGGALFFTHQMSDKQEEARVQRVQTLEMGKIPDASQNSPVEVEADRSDPNFVP